MSEFTPKHFTKELWRKLPGAYMVSNLGRVYSLGNAKRPRGCMLRASPATDGYRYVTLYSGRSGRTSGSKVKVAVLVLQAFVGPCVGLDSCHRNGVSTDDRLSNLYWGTRLKNVDDARLHGTMPKGERHGQAKLSDAIVAEILLSTESGVALSKRYGVSQSAISMYRSKQRRAT